MDSAAVRLARCLVLVLALTAVAGCAATKRGTTTPDKDAPRPTESESTDAGRPTPAGEVDPSVVALLEEAADAPANEQATWRLRIARANEAAGRDVAARAEYAWATGSARRDEAAAAWDGIARLRRAAGDEPGAVVAEMEAWIAAPSGERGNRESALQRSASKLEAGTLRRLARIAPSAGGNPLAEELARRGPLPERVIALLIPLSGRFESFGKAFRTGAEVALEDRKAAQPGAPSIQLFVEDTAGDLRQATAAARRAVLEHEATVLIGPLLSVPALGAGAIAESFGTPLVAPTATDPQVGQVGPHVLSLEPSAHLLAQPLAKAAVEVAGARRIGALVPRAAVAEDREKEFRAAVEGLGAEIVLSLSYEAAERDFRKLLEKLEAANVDAVYAPGDAAELEALVPQLEFYGFRARILGHGGWTSARAANPGASVLEGALLSVESTDNPNSPVAASLRKVVATREKAEPTRFHTEGYRAMSAVLFAMDHGATSREALTESLRARAGWSSWPPGEQVQLLTVRDGELRPLDESGVTPKLEAPPEPGG